MPTEFEPTPQDRALVETLAGYGVPQEGIAKLVKISIPTLTKHFAEELEVGVLKANLAVAGNLFRMATGDGKGAAVSAFFWLKTRARWKETPQEVDLTVSDKRERTPDERARAMALMLAKRSNDDGRVDGPESDDRSDVRDGVG